MLDWLRSLPARQWVIASCAFIISSAFAIAVIHAVNKSNDEADRAIRAEKREDELIALVQHQQSMMETEQARSDERWLSLNSDFDEFKDTHKALLVYLRQRGIYVPERYIPPDSADSSTVRAESDDERRDREDRESRSRGDSSGGGSSGGTGDGSGKAPSPGKNNGGSGNGGNDSGGKDSPGKSGDKSKGQNKGGKSRENKQKGKKK